MVIVVARIKAKPGLDDEMAGNLEQLVDKTRAEAGCLQYDLHRNDEDPTRFLFYERWESAAHLDTHMKTEHFLDIRARTEPLSDGEAVIETYTLVR